MKIDVRTNVTNQLLRSLRLVRILRIAQLMKADIKLRALSDQIGVNPRLFKLFELLAVLLYLAHILVCAWYAIAIGQSIGVEDTWLGVHSAAAAPDALETPGGPISSA